MSVIHCKIDVTKIAKDRLFKGAKGTYLDCTLVETPNNAHGNSHMIVQDVSKEERQAGVKGVILGNAKTFAPQSSGNQPPRRQAPPPDDDLAF